MIESIVLRRNHPVDKAELNALRAGSWDGGQGGHDWLAVLRHSLGWITAHYGDRLVGFVNVAWDGGDRAFLLDTTTARDLQRQGIGSRLVGEAIELARSAGCQWLHVDSDADLMERFYEPGGFRPTPAGLVNLRQASDPDGVERSDRPPRLAVHVRAESDPDRDGVDALYRAVGGDMGELMTRLRLPPELVLPMTLVAVADNVVVGHIAFSHGTL